MPESLATAVDQSAWLATHRLPPPGRGLGADTRLVGRTKPGAALKGSLRRRGGLRHWSSPISLSLDRTSARAPIPVLFYHPAGGSKQTRTRNSQ